MCWKPETSNTFFSVCYNNGFKANLYSWNFIWWILVLAVFYLSCGDQLICIHLWEFLIYMLLDLLISQSVVVVSAAASLSCNLLVVKNKYKGLSAIGQCKPFFVLIGPSNKTLKSKLHLAIYKNTLVHSRIFSPYSPCYFDSCHNFFLHPHLCPLAMVVQTVKIFKKWISIV